jgi:hypothetical protein
MTLTKDRVGSVASFTPDWARKLKCVRVMRSLAFGTGPMPTMFKAFRTTEASSGTYEMRFKFRTLEEMQRADREWHEFRSAAKVQS